MNQADLVERVREFAGRHGLLAEAGRVVVGFSGGVDSTALLLLMRQLAPAVTAVHLHHGLRPEADADEAWCRAFCAARGIDYASYRLDVPGHRQVGESLEMAARRRRLETWRVDLAGRPGAVLALGHHLDDLVETFVQRLYRGSNATGLTGLRPWRRHGSVTIVRPLLELRRSELAAWLLEQGVTDTRHDASNDDPRVQRNAIRHRVLPALESVAPMAGIARSLELLAEDARCLEAQAAAVPEPLTVADLLATPPNLWSRLLRELLRRRGFGGGPVRGTVVTRLRELLKDGPPARPVRLPAGMGIDLAIERGLVTAVARRQPAVTDLAWAWRDVPTLELPDLGMRLVARTMPRPEAASLADPNSTWWPVAALPPVLTVRARRPGDRFVPFGAIEDVRVKKVVGDAKVETWQKHRLLVVATPGDEILWLCPLRRGACYPLSPDDDPVVQLLYEPGEDEDEDVLA